MHTLTPMLPERLETLRVRLELRHAEAVARHAGVVDDRRFLLLETDVDLVSLADVSRAARDAADAVTAIAEMLAEIRSRQAERQADSARG